MISLAERIRGGVYGLAVGDALGAPVEGMSRAEIQERHGILQDMVDGWLKAGEWTDDTEMMLAVAEGVIKDPADPVPHIGEAFLRWWATDPPDIGNIVRSTFLVYTFLRDRYQIDDWHRAAREVHQHLKLTAGNGALMRTLPLAFAYPAPAELYMWCMEIARMTHWDPEAGFTCFLYCRTVQGLLEGKELPAAFARALAEMQKEAPPGEVGRAASLLAGKLAGVLDWPEEQMQPSGYTVDTLACALWCAAHSKSLEEAVVKAVNLGGDADTTGAVTGGLAGVMYGYRAIPRRWQDELNDDRRARLDAAVEGLMALVEAER
ncbi:ADP-ribosylglycohydrolase family protein [Desulfothermobacter acidiphilus]|uniref:ADP-ribosylglycohydrolase family protein n=1 Tax=Desulfothermobacter acidiphilus TaxID=1938353 RepID=UPI003F88712E